MPADGLSMWTVNTTLELYALNSVGGPSEGRSTFFFFSK